MTNTRTLDRDCCDYEVYSHGKVIGVFDMPKDEANQLVVKLSKKTGNRIDWHYFGGRVVMKMLLPKPTANARHLVSRNQREGYFWHGLNEQGAFKMRMHPINGERPSLREYSKWLKKG